MTAFVDFADDERTSHFSAGLWLAVFTDVRAFNASVFYKNIHAASERGAVFRKPSVVWNFLLNHKNTSAYRRKSCGCRCKNLVIFERDARIQFSARSIWKRLFFGGKWSWTVLPGWKNCLVWIFGKNHAVKLRLFLNFRKPAENFILRGNAVPVNFIQNHGKFFLKIFLPRGEQNVHSVRACPELHFFHSGNFARNHIIKHKRNADWNHNRKRDRNSNKPKINRLLLFHKNTYREFRNPFLYYSGAGGMSIFFIINCILN